MKDDKTDPDHEGEDAVTEGEAAVSGDAATLGEAQEETDGGSAEHSAERDLEAELAAAQDAALRAQADAVNMQRRSEQEIEKARKFALERFCGDLLSVVDNLERALESAGDDQGIASLLEGIELTRKGLMDVLVKYGVESVDPMGEPFDPETAQAMSMVEQPDAEPNSVIGVMQKGYTLNGRLLRPAMVMVAKAPSE
ncbi:MAG: nucleotide exchange factor GrpE [Luminiphilus sp.]|jgi:molecular chaperone GrpE|nr:nucleotide exchange factor GrpE [Luminiphilus sp.]MDA8619600.1 nucleotide exchange factor GrpE [Luminiphilus sp.]MDB2689064.1 nucleotide exchange factor GrpE [Luminiphilus sp.]MDG1214891.1 nucleotide exchange factor GrpE [Luminiphilus sp.]